MSGPAAGKPPATMWVLRTRDDGEPLAFRLLPGAAKTIGRAPQADFVLDRALVSRLHCRVVLGEGGELVVEDLGSTNGTFVNGRRVTRAAVAPGDVISVGRVELVASLEPP